MCTWKLSCVKKNADEGLAIVLKTKHRRICLNLFVMTSFVTNYLKESINIDDKCGQRVHVLFFILRTVFDRVYSCLHLFFPVISCPHFPFFSISFHIYSPFWKRPFHYGRRVIAWTGSWTFLVSIRSKTVLCQSLSVLTNLVRQHFLTSVERPLDTLCSLHNIVFLVVLD